MILFSKIHLQLFQNLKQLLFEENKENLILNSEKRGNLRKSSILQKKSLCLMRFEQTQGECFAIKDREVRAKQLFR